MVGTSAVAYQTSPVDWSAIAAIAALVGALFAGWAVFVQGRGTRRELRNQNLWRLIDRWDALQGKRLKAAKYIFDNWDDRANLPGSAYEVLDTLELLGYLVKTKTLSLDDVWINFSGSAIVWWHVCLPGIEATRAADRTFYEYFAELVERLQNLEANRLKQPE